MLACVSGCSSVCFIVHFMSRVNAPSFIFSITWPPPRSTLFPYTTLFRSQGFVKSIEGKLSNEKFVANAPEAVVERERKKLADGKGRVAMLEESLAKLGE